jgi:hypothetical protein
MLAGTSRGHVNVIGLGLVFVVVGCVVDPAVLTEGLGMHPANSETTAKAAMIWRTDLSALPILSSGSFGSDSPECDGAESTPYERVLRRRRAILMDVSR